jgi:5-methylcytosine-specific restriction endonuclease McrA
MPHHYIRKYATQEERYASRRKHTTEEKRLAAGQAASALYRATHLEEVRERDRTSARKRREANPERQRVLAQKSYAKHVEANRARAKAYRLKNAAIVRARDRARYAANPQKRGVNGTANMQRWRKANPDKATTIQNRRRARVAQVAINDFTALQWAEMQAAQAHRCYYCHKRCKGKLTQDHILPLSKGGSHTLHNVIGACRSCNSRKNDRSAPKPVQPFLLTIAAAKQPKVS